MTPPPRRPQGPPLGPRAARTAPARAPAPARSHLSQRPELGAWVHPPRSLSTSYALAAGWTQLLGSLRQAGAGLGGGAGLATRGGAEGRGGAGGEGAGLGAGPGDAGSGLTALIDSSSSPRRTPTCYVFGAVSHPL